MTLEGFAAKSANNLVEALRKAAHAELPRLLYGLGIPEVGVSVARDLARHFGTFAGLRGADEAGLQEVPGVGPRMAEQITAFFREPKTVEVLDALLGKLELIETTPAPASLPSDTATAAVLPLAGKKIVFTGGLSRLSRPEAQELIERLGARATGSVSKSTDWVVIGEDAGSKADNARKLGVATLDEEGGMTSWTEEHFWAHSLSALWPPAPGIWSAAGRPWRP
jgi:DNA ligase (NAD+)